MQGAYIFWPAKSRGRHSVCQSSHPAGSARSGRWTAGHHRARSPLPCWQGLIGRPSGETLVLIVSWFDLAVCCRENHRGLDSGDNLGCS